MKLFFLLFLSSLFAAPIGNPTAPSLLDEGLFIPDTSWTNFQAGFTQDFLLQKKFRPSRTSQLQSASKSSLSGSAELFYAIWDIRERFNIQLSVGPALFDWSWIQSDGRLEAESNVGLFGSLSGSLILIEVKETSLAVEGQIGGWDWSQSSLSLNGQPISQKAESYFYYWQAGAAFTQKVGLFAPYFGCMVNQTTFRANQLPTGSARLRSLIIVGPFAGCTIGTQIASLNFEWRGWFEEGLSFSCQFRF